MSFRPQGDHAGLDTNSSIANHFQKANLAGTKWSHVSTGRTGINSILDKDIIRPFANQNTKHGQRIHSIEIARRRCRHADQHRR